jgi:hypothetical protein
MCQKKVVLREFSLFGTGLRRGGGSEKPRGEENAERVCAYGPVNRSDGIGGRGGGCNAADGVGLMVWKMPTEDSAELVNPSKFTLSLMSEIS